MDVIVGKYSFEKSLFCRPENPQKSSSTEIFAWERNFSKILSDSDSAHRGGSNEVLDVGYRRKNFFDLHLP